jgi:hypothetical protein
MSTVTVTTEDGTQIDTDTSEDRINRYLLIPINSGSDREDDEPIDAAHAA